MGSGELNSGFQACTAKAFTHGATTVAQEQLWKLGLVARPHIIPALGRLEARAQSGLCTKKKGNEREKSFHMLKRWLATSKAAQKWAGHQKDRAWLEGWDYVLHTSLRLRGKS